MRIYRITTKWGADPSDCDWAIADSVYGVVKKYKKNGQSGSIKSIEMEGMIDHIDGEALFKKHIVGIKEALKKDSVFVREMLDDFFMDRLIERIKDIGVFIDLLKSHKIEIKKDLSIDNEPLKKVLGDFLVNELTDKN